MSVGRSSGSTCLSNDEVLRLREGTLEDSERRAAVEHIESCPDCLELLGRREGSPTHASPGEVATALEDRFELREPLGRGGMGVVYRAFDRRLDREVAIKLLHDAMFDADLGIRDRLLAESKAMARLRHPNVVAVYDVVLTERSGFVVMELVVGDTLRRWLHGRQPPWREVVHMYIQAGRGLSAAHEAGLVHRDFKPDNVLVDEHDRPQVTDFGLANAVVPHASVESVNTQTSIVTAGRCGTPAYMPPEQVEGAAVDARADVFAFCVALWEAVSGQRPFAEESVGVRLEAIRSHALPVPAPGLMPARLRQVLARGLKADPDSRPSSMAALLQTLQSLVSEPAARRVWRPLVAATLLGAAVTAVAVRSSSEGTECPEATHWRSLEDRQFDQLERQLAGNDSNEIATATLTATRVRRDLEVFDQKLSMSRAETCRLGAAGGIPQQELAARDVCFDRLQVRLETVVELLREGTTQAAEELGSPRLFDRCTRWAAARAEVGPAPPTDRRLPALLERAGVLTAVDAPDAPAQAREAVRLAEDLHHLSSLAEAHQHVASALWVVDREAALVSMDAAAVTAREAEDPAREVAVWILRSILSADDGDAEETNRALAQAEQALERVRTPWLREELLTLVKTAQSMSALFDGDGELALRRAIESRDLAREHRPALVPQLTEQIATLRGVGGDMEGVLDEWVQLAAWHEARGPTGSADLVLILLDIADVQAELGRPKEARRRLRKAESIARTVTLAPQVPSMIAMTHANVAVAEEDLDAALVAATRAVQASPTGSTERREARGIRAHVLMRLRRLPEATGILEDLRASLELEADQTDFGLSYDIVADLAEAYRRAGRPQQALEIIEPLWAWFRDNYPDVPEARGIALSLAWTYVDLRRETEAAPLFERVLASQPSPPQEHWARAGLASLKPDRDAETDDALAKARAWFAAFPDSRAYELERVDAIDG